MHERSREEGTGKNRGQLVLNLTLATVAGQVGCLTLVIIFAALIGGLWLDSQFHTRPLFVLILLIASIPVTIVVMYRVALAATARIKPVGSNDRSQEESDGGTNP